MHNATPVLPLKTRRPTFRHYLLRINFRLFSFFRRTTRAKINPGSKHEGWALDRTRPPQCLAAWLLTPKAKLKSTIVCEFY